MGIAVRYTESVKVVIDNLRAGLLAVIAVLIAASVLVGPAEGTTGLATYDRALSPRLTGWDDPRLRRGDETDLAFATRVTDVVSDAIYHCEPSEPQSLLSPLVATGEGILHPAHLRCGFCHQSAFVLAEALVRGGISAYARGLNGHVVTALSLDGTEYVADPDYGVMPFAIDWDDALPSALAAYVAVPDSEQPRVRRAYGTADDDGPYYTMAHLRSLAERQDAALAFGPLLILVALVVVTLERKHVRVDRMIVGRVRRTDNADVDVTG
jgi:hypothetical protein